MTMAMITRVDNYLEEHYIGEDMYLIDGRECEEDEAREYVEEMFWEMDDIDAAWYARWN